MLYKPYFFPVQIESEKTDEFAMPLLVSPRMTTEERAQKYARQPEVDFLHSSAVVLNKPLGKSSL